MISVDGQMRNQMMYCLDLLNQRLKILASEVMFGAQNNAVSRLRTVRDVPFAACSPVTLLALGHMINSSKSHVENRYMNAASRHVPVSQYCRLPLRT